MKLQERDTFACIRRHQAFALAPINCDEPASKFAFDINLRRYTKDIKVGKTYMKAAAKQSIQAAIDFLKELKACGAPDTSRMCFGCRLRH